MHVHMQFCVEILKGHKTESQNVILGQNMAKFLPLNSLCGVKFGNVEKNLFSYVLLPRVKFLQSLCQF